MQRDAISLELELRHASHWPSTPLTATVRLELHPSALGPAAVTALQVPLPPSRCALALHPPLPSQIGPVQDAQLHPALRHLSRGRAVRACSSPPQQTQTLDESMADTASSGCGSTVPPRHPLPEDEGCGEAAGTTQVRAFGLEKRDTLWMRAGDKATGGYALCHSSVHLLSLLRRHCCPLRVAQTLTTR